MRKNYFYLAFLFLLCNTISFAQKVILTPTAVNGASVSSAGPINLGSTPSSTVSLGIRVEMPSIPGNTGTISIYSLNGLNANVVTGGNGGSLIFNEGNVASRSFVVNLNWSAFPTSGGYLYAEYKTSGGVTYKSGYISVVKSPTMGGGTVNPPADALNPAKIPNTLCCNQIVRLGDKPTPIMGSQYLDPYENYIYGINSRWNIGNGSIINLDDITRTLYLDYAKELKNITVTRELGYKGNNEYPNKSNTVTITVVPSPILTNTILTNDTPNSEGYYELSSVKTLNLYGFASKVNLNMVQDPMHTNVRGDDIVDVESYRWEYKTSSSALIPWIPIATESSSDINFSDPSQLSNFEDAYYEVRRIAIYKNISRISNEIKIVVRGLRLNNTICCDQTLKIQSPSNFEPPQIITGSIPSFEFPTVEGTNYVHNYITYQWQSQTTEDGRSISTWSNISGATSKDYLPSQPLMIQFDGRRGYKFTYTYKYRRIATIHYSIITNKVIYATASSYSNETFLDGTITQTYIQIYPNPTSSILNIECTADISDAKITISNVMGGIVNSNNYSVLNSKLININVANLPTGTYFITIENQHVGITQRTFIKQ